MIKMIWAQTKNGVIGNQGKLPWTIKEEMDHFRTTTQGADVLMGSKTFDSMNQKPLPKRMNYVLTSKPEKYQHIVADNLAIISSLDEIIAKYAQNKTNILFIIGGNIVYEQAFANADEIIKTTINDNYSGDTYIAKFDYSNFALIKKDSFDQFEVEYLERKTMNEKEIKPENKQKAVKAVSETKKTTTATKQATGTKVMVKVKPDQEAKPAKSVSVAKTEPKLEAKTTSEVQPSVEQTKVIAAPVAVKKATKQNDEDREQFYFDPWKMVYMWPVMLHIKRKAQKINRKNRKQPGSYSEEYCYNWVKKAVNKIIYLTNTDVKVEGMENWLDRGIILAPNHQSNIDPIVLLAINNFQLQQPVAFIAKQELWDSKSMGRFVRLIDCIPLDRQSPRSALEAFKEAKELIVDYRRSLVIFPEGTRSGSQEVGLFHAASLKVAQMANVPVVPVTIIGSFRADKTKRTTRRNEIKVIFSKPIMGQKHISLKTEDLTNNVRKEIVASMKIWENKEPNYELRKPKKNKEKTKKKPEKKSLRNLFKIVD